MHPHGFPGRSLTASLVIIITVIGAALRAAPAAAADGGSTPRYGRLPVIARDWSRLGVQPDGSDPAGREDARQAVVARRWREVHELVGDRHVSKVANELLARRQAALRSGDAAKAEAYDGIDTLRVLLVRISFDTNREPSLTTIPADGDFMLTPPAVPDLIPVDPAPHDKAFFEAHMAGLSEYYRFQSGGRLHIEGRVLPDGDQDSYTISDVADYGPGRDGYWTIESLEALVRDMITAADQGAVRDGVDLGDYDDDNPFTYIIFVHSGSDWQSDVAGDSPNDIPTFFISLGEPQPLANGQLTECSIIPETTSQDGYPGSIAAAFYHEFGHALGLPDVYSTRTAYPTVGIWDLMDSGTNLPVVMGAITDEGDTVFTVATGVLPPSLSAWSRWFLGWLEVDEPTRLGNSMYLPATGVMRDEYLAYRAVNPFFNLNSPQAVRLGVSPREWFLLENRWVPAGAWETPYDDLFFERDEPTGVVQYLSGESFGAYRNTGLYDFFMPAGGVLAWHVNMDRIEEGLPTNTINYDGDGLRLVEADGIQDVGVLDAYVLGWTGSVYDPFGGYMYDADGNRLENDFRTMDPQRPPHSRCFDRSWTGVSISEVETVGPNAAVMRLVPDVAGVRFGFPLTLDAVADAEAGALGGEAGARALDGSSLTPVLLGPASVLVFADAAPAQWQGDAWPTGLNAVDVFGVARWPGAGGPGRPAREFARLSGTIAGAPVAWNEADGSARLLCGTAAGSVSLRALPVSGLPTVLWTRDAGGALDTAPLVVSDESGQRSVLCSVGGGTLMRLALIDGSVTATLDLDAGSPPVGVAGLAVRASAAGDRVLVAAAGGLHVVTVGSADLAQAWAAAYDRTPEGPLRLVAAGPSGEGRIAVYDDAGLLGAWLEDGTPADAPDPGERLVAAPAVADVDGDGRDDIVLVTGRRVVAAQPDGTPLRGFPAPLVDMFPLADTTRFLLAPVVADLDGDGVNEVTTGTDGGHLISLTGAGRLRAEHPWRWGDRAGGGLAVGPAGADSTRTLWLASTGGYAGPPLDRDLTNGRITGLQLARPAAADLRTSEWLGTGGGSVRSGPEGVARALGAAAPATSEAGRIVLYPNPVTGPAVTVRVAATADGRARATLFNLEGEPVADASFAVAAGLVTEHAVSVPDIASGLYLCRIDVPAAGGRRTETLTLAVER